jgi:hypothetical protein
MIVRDGVAVFIAPGGIPIWFDHESVNQIIGAPRSRRSRHSAMETPKRHAAAIDLHEHPG